jgi:hypothetical protein
MYKFRESRRVFRRKVVLNAEVTDSSTSQSSTDDPKGRETKQTVEVDFRELADGTLVETIEDPHDPTEITARHFQRWAGPLRGKAGEQWSGVGSCAEVLRNYPSCLFCERS